MVKAEDFGRFQCKFGLRKLLKAIVRVELLGLPLHKCDRVNIEH